MQSQTITQKLSVDRRENDFVILLDENETVYQTTTEALGFCPEDGDILCAVLDENRTILSARFDPEATHQKRRALRDKLRAHMKS